MRSTRSHRAPFQECLDLIDGFGWSSTAALRGVWSAGPGRTVSIGPDRLVPAAVLLTVAAVTGWTAREPQVRTLTVRECVPARARAGLDPDWTIEDVRTGAADLEVAQGVVLLAAMVEAATARPLADLVDDELLRELGLRGAAADTRPHGEPLLTAGLEELLRVCAWLASAGALDDRALLGWRALPTGVVAWDEPGTGAWAAGWLLAQQFVVVLADADAAARLRALAYLAASVPDSAQSSNAAAMARPRSTA